MRSTFHGLETAKRSLFAQQTALHTTGHNIANANTAGYTRQVVNMQASKPLEALGLMRSNIPGQIGTGVQFDSITRIREQFLDDQFRNENKALGSWTVQRDTLEKLEAIVNEPSETGMRSIIDKFWDSWSDLAKDPENITGRKIVRESALALADAFNATSKQLSDLSNDLTENINTQSAQINTALTSIGNLNREIQRIEGLGHNANDLRDQRDLLTDNISKLINIDVRELDTGYSISMGAINLVNGSNTTLTTPAMLEDAYQSGELNSGEVFGLIRSRDTYVADYQNQLNIMAQSIAEGEITITLPAGSVLPEGTVLNGVTYSNANGNRTLTTDLTVQVNGLNGLHQLGYNLSDPVTQGDVFFVSSDGGPITAANFRLNQLIADDPGRIASSARTFDDNGTETVVRGNNTLALLMAELKDTRFQFAAPGSAVGEGTMNDYFRSVVGQLGVQTQEAIRQSHNQTILVDHVDFSRQAVSGVSLDEEVTNMIKFQHAYNAAARAMTVFDETLDRVINGMGIVGR